jgi:hypothetical protein
MRDKLPMSLRDDGQTVVSFARQASDERSEITVGPTGSTSSKPAYLVWNKS